MKSIKVSSHELMIVLEILKKHLPAKTTVWAFGSRVKGNIKKFSDLDLVIDANGKPLSLATMAQLAYEFEESSLPYKVDIVDWQNIDDVFKKLIQEDKRLIWSD